MCILARHWICSSVRLGYSRVLSTMTTSHLILEEIALVRGRQISADAGTPVLAKALSVSSSNIPADEILIDKS